jgi:hypothetical protein
MTTDNLPSPVTANKVVPMNLNFLPIQQEGQDIWKWAQMLAQAPFYQKLGVGGVAAIILTARELRLPPMACLNGLLYSVDGKITMSGQLMNAMIANAGHEAKIVELTRQRCTIRFKRSNESTAQTYSFTIEDAKEAKLAHKDNWVKYPRDMLFNRCISAGARKYMPEVIGPYYTHEELVTDYKPSPADIVMHVDVVTENNITDLEEAPITQEIKDPLLQKISAPQLELLHHMIKQVDDAVVTNLCEYLQKRFGVTDYPEMTQEAFELCASKLKLNIEAKNKKVAA